MAMSDPVTQALLWEILQRQDQLEANTRPRVGWVMAIIIAVVINLFAVPYLQQHDVPYLSVGLNAVIEWEAEAAIDLGILAADTLTGVTRVAPALQSGQQIIGLSNAQAQAFAHNVSQTESTHDDRVINRYGYVGRWQFGASALAAVGLIKRSALEQAGRGVQRGYRGQREFLENEANWTIKGGLTTFRNSRVLQDKAFVDLCNSNIREGFRLRVLSDQTPAHKIAGWAKAAHLKGTHAAKRWYKYRHDSHDANGTRVSVYAMQAEQAVIKASSTSASTAQPTTGVL